MNGLFKVMCCAGTVTERDGKKFYSVVVTSDDTVIKMSCTEDAYRVLEANKLKREVEVTIKLSEFNGQKSWKIVSAVEPVK